MSPKRLMKRISKPRGGLGFTLIELLVVIGIIGLLAAILFPVLARVKAKAKRVECMGNLRQIGLGFRVFATEHEGRFPAEVRERYGGVMEHVETGGAYQHFKAISDAIDSTHILICPSDTKRERADWDELTDDNVSYQVGIDAKSADPYHILSADRNIVPVTKTIVTVRANSDVEWTKELHRMEGNILFADGRVESAGNGDLRELFRQSLELQ